MVSIATRDATTFIIITMATKKKLIDNHSRINARNLPIKNSTFFISLVIRKSRVSCHIFFIPHLPLKNLCILHIVIGVYVAHTTAHI